MLLASAPPTALTYNISNDTPWEIGSVYAKSYIGALWNPERTPGGSSGASAAAVATGVAPNADASDGGGSIGVVAANRGLFGLQPAHGARSIGGSSGPCSSRPSPVLIGRRIIP